MVAAITAGGRVSGALATAMRTDVKALAEIAGTTLIARIVAAAREAEAARVVVVGGHEVRAACAATVEAVIDADDDGRINLQRALETAGDDSMLLLSSDLPFVSGAALTDFITRCGGAQAAMALADADEYARSFPGAPPHAVRLAGERVANGSVFYLAPNVAPRVLSIAQRLFGARKSLVRLAAFLGPALLLRFATGRLRIENIERRAQAALGLSARAVRGCSPSLCYDVDTLEDYRYALEHAARR